MQSLSPEVRVPRAHVGGCKWFVRSVRISGSQSDHRCLCPVRVLFYSPTKTQDVLLYRVMSVDLQFRMAPKDLMKKFVDCLVRLPNLRTLELFDASHIGPITRGLKRKCARFSSVRELWINDKTVKFVRSCPNVESIITQDGLSWESTEVLGSYRKELGRLKRVIGVVGCCVRQGKLGDILLSETPIY